MMYSVHTPASRSWLHAALGGALALSIVLSAACKPPAENAECVSVGMGWRACSNGMPAALSGGASMPEPAAQPKPAQNTPKGGSGGGIVTGRPAAAAASGGEGGAASASGGGGARSRVSGGDSAAGAGTSGNDGGSGNVSAGGMSAGSTSAGSSGEGGSAGRAGTRAEPASAGGAGEAGLARTSAGASSVPTTCCHALGVCVQSVSLQEQQRRLLVPESCSAQGELCAPTTVLAADGFVPKTCRSVLQGEGRCLPDCMAGLAGQADKLPRDTCDTHELCAPCFDPISGSATGSCRLGADPGPHELPHMFRGCCVDGTGATQGSCVPLGYIPSGAAAPKADCGAELFCVPRQRIVDPNAKPVECSTDIRGHGVCLPQCIADALVLLVTVQATCPSNNACFPCELVSGDSTGVCTAP
jgi:hypothetical protein